MNLFKKPSQKPAVDHELLEEIGKTKEQMDNAYYKFQYAIDPDLIDCYIFESNAAWKKYKFLMKQAKRTLR